MHSFAPQHAVSMHVKDHTVSTCKITYMVKVYTCLRFLRLCHTFEARSSGQLPEAFWLHAGLAKRPDQRMKVSNIYIRA